AVTTTSTTGASSIWRPTAGYRWTSPSGSCIPARRRKAATPRCDGSTWVAWTRTGWPSTAITDSPSPRPGRTFAPTRSTTSAAKSSGRVATSTTTSGVTTSPQACCRNSPQTPPATLADADWQLRHATTSTHHRRTPRPHGPNEQLDHLSGDRGEHGRWQHTVRWRRLERAGARSRHAEPCLFGNRRAPTHQRAASRLARPRRRDLFCGQGEQQPGGPAIDERSRRRRGHRVRRRNAAQPEGRD